MNIGKMLSVFAKMSIKNDMFFIEEIRYKLAGRTANSEILKTEKTDQINISETITGIKEWFFRTKELEGINPGNDYLEREFNHQITKAILELNGWLAYCEENEESINRFISMGDEEKYTSRYFEVFLYSEETSPIYQKYIRLGKKREYLTINLKEKTDNG